MIKVTITNDILNSIIEIELNRYKISLVELSQNVLNKLRKNSKIKSSYASNKIEGNPLSEKQAEEVIAKDDIVDDLFLKVKEEVIQMLRESDGSGEEAADLLLIAKYFERIGDHATNISEWVIYSITGKHVS